MISNNSITDDAKKFLFDMKSAKVYQQWYEKYINFVNVNNQQISCNSVLNFFGHIAAEYCASSLWQCYSCIGKYLLVNHNVNIKESELIELPLMLFQTIRTIRMAPHQLKTCISLIAQGL